MDYVDLIVHLDNSSESNARLDVAIEVARAYEARLTGLWVSHQPVEIPLVGSAGEGGSAIAELGAEVAAKQTFWDRVKRSNLSGEWRAVTGNPAEVVVIHARYADLAVIGQPNGFGQGTASRVAVETVLTAGRPVLFVPYAGKFESIGNNIMVAWNGSHPAARAVNDAIPFLRKAKTVTIVTVNPDEELIGGASIAATDLALHLARHGVVAEATHLAAPGFPVADALLNRAFDLGVDLLVAGAYGYSKLRERLFGGTTHDLLDRMTVPVLMSH